MMEKKGLREREREREKERVRRVFFSFLKKNVTQVTHEIIQRLLLDQLVSFSYQQIRVVHRRLCLRIRTIPFFALTRRDFVSFFFFNLIDCVSCVSSFYYYYYFILFYFFSFRIDASIDRCAFVPRSIDLQHCSYISATLMEYLKSLNVEFSFIIGSVVIISRGLYRGN